MYFKDLKSISEALHEERKQRFITFLKSIKGSERVLDYTIKYGLPNKLYVGTKAHQMLPLDHVIGSFFPVNVHELIGEHQLWFQWPNGVNLTDHLTL